MGECGCRRRRCVLWLCMKSRVCVPAIPARSKACSSAHEKCSGRGRISRRCRNEKRATGFERGRGVTRQARQYAEDGGDAGVDAELWRAVLC